MNIFILEDDLLQQQRLKQTIEEICQGEKIQYQHLIATARPEVLLEKMNLASRHNLYFLDIEIDQVEKTGLEVAQSIRQEDPFGTIVFITTHSEMAPLTFAYKVSALDFIEKDQDEVQIREEVKTCLQLAVEKTGQSVRDDAFIFQNKYTNLQIPYSDIYYFETTGISHKLRLVAAKKVMEFYGELKEIETMDERLLRCHRAFVINLDNIVSIDRTNKTVRFPNGDECLISRRQIKEVTNKINQ